LKSEQIFDCGLPRNDILFSATDDFKNDLKNKLGLPKDKKVIFYCPTWRRGDYKAELPFDIGLLKECLSDEYVLLIRSHVGKHKWVDENNKPVEIFDNKFSFNGGEYPEATHLYLISDILVSDYSSSIFDFAITRKPQVLYLYDKEQYEKEFGLYYDIETFSPFPVAKNQTELIEKIKNYNVPASDYEKFISSYTEYEKGDAARQIVNYICKESIR